MKSAASAKPNSPPIGEEAYAKGRVAILMVAGGMGSRSASSGPKGCFEVGAHSGKSIYQIQAEKVFDASRRSGRAIPFLVMTSPVTDAETRDYFAANGNFGLADDQVRFLAKAPFQSLDADGKALLAAPGKLLENPDGHGSCFTALVASGQCARLQEEGVEFIVYIQVDNILVPVDDPLLLGLAEAESADVITKVLPKAHPDEKVGHLVRVGDADHIIEYTELSPEECRQVGPDGQLIYRWGSPAMHCWRVSFLANLAATGFKPALHRSSKPLKAWQNGEKTEVQGWKSERFIFDLIPQAKVSVGLFIDRDDEFAPVKNAEGTDSPRQRPTTDERLPPPLARIRRRRSRLKRRPTHRNQPPLRRLPHELHRQLGPATPTHRRRLLPRSKSVGFSLGALPPPAA